MTIQVDSRITEAVETDGVSKRFDFNFPLFKGDDDQGLEVRFVNELGYDVVDREDYSLVVGLENKGGHVLFHVAPEAGLSLVIAGKTPLDQSLDITNPGKFFAQSVERSLDKITSMIQEFVSTLDEETRQRINNDKDLRERLDTRFAELAASIDQRFQGKWTEMSDYLNSLLPMFFCIMRKEIDEYARTGLIDVIDSRIAEIIDDVRNDAQAAIDNMMTDFNNQLSAKVQNFDVNANQALINVQNQADEILEDSINAANRAEVAATRASLMGSIFPDPESGVDPVTGVADGAYFNVRSSSDESYVDEYQNVGGVPTPTGKSYPSSNAKWDAAFVVDASGKNQQQINYLSLARYDSLVSITDYGASPEKTAAENDIALAAAIADLNAKYTGLDGFLRASPPKCALMIPSNGEYKFSGNFHITGNYSLLMYGICKHEGTVANTPFIKIGRQVEYDNLANNEYVLNAYTTNAGTYGFELLNMVCSYIQTRKIKGFKEGLRCIARGGRGFFGNTVRIGTFDSNIIDIHIRAETSGAPNANRFYDGFFYKQRNMTVEQNCVKFSSDGTYNDTDSNLFDGLNFEEGKATEAGKVDCIPINLEVGVYNRFINIRTEKNSNTALARVNKRGNTIEVRAAFTTSTEIISSNIQQTLVIPQDEMQRVYSSGDLARESIKLATSGKVWNPNITFNDANVLNFNSTISTSAPQLFDLTNAGIKFLNQRSMLSFKVKTNGDRRFLLRTFADDYAKRLKTAIACYDAAGNRLSNDPAIAIGTWGVQQRIKSNDNVPLSYSATAPWGGSGAYLTPITNFQTRIPFEVHPSVAMIEVYYFWAGDASGNDITLSHFELYSLEGNTSVMDAALPTPTTGDRWLYQPLRGALTYNLSASSAFDPPSLAASGSAGSSIVQNIIVPGAALGDIVGAAFNQDLQSVVLDAWVSSTGVVSVKFTNTGTAPVDLASGTISVLLRRLVT